MNEEFVKYVLANLPNFVFAFLGMYMMQTTINLQAKQIERLQNALIEIKKPHSTAPKESD